MINPKLLMFCYLSFICGHILCLMLEGTWVGDSEESLINSLCGFKVAQMSGLGIWAIPKLMIGFFTTGIPKLIMWDYSFFYGTFELFRFTFLIAISVGVVWGVTVTFASFIYGLANKILGW